MTLRIAEVSGNENQISESAHKSCLSILPEIYRNMIIQFAQELKAEDTVLVNYK
jgi:hypothetical protein